VELQSGGAWGTVHNSQAFPFSANEASVACHQLGEELGFVSLSGKSISSGDTPDGTLNCILSDLDCDGTETALGQCLTSGSTTCDSNDNSDDLGLRCKFALDTCTSCLPGTFSDGASRGGCSACPQNTFSESYAAISCNDCLFGRGSAKGAMSSNQCFSSEELWSNAIVLVSGSGDPAKSIQKLDVTRTENIDIQQSLPRGLVFLDSGNFLFVRSDLNDYKVRQYKADGTAVGTFATLPSRLLDVLLLSDLGLIAISCANNNVYFFNMADGVGDGKLTKTDAVSEVFLPKTPESLARGEGQHEILVATLEADGAMGPVYRRCIPDFECDRSTRDTKLVDKGKSVAVDREFRTFFILGDEVRSTVYQCPLGIEDGVASEDCKKIAVSIADFVYLNVEPSKKLLYTVDKSNLHAYTYKGAMPLDPENDPSNLLQTTSCPELVSYEELSKVYFRPFFAVQSSQVSTGSTGSTSITVTAGENMDLPLTLYDQFKNVLATEEEVRNIQLGLVIEASGPIPTILPGIDGNVIWNGESAVIRSSSSAGYTIQGGITLNVATSWEVSVMGADENQEVKHLSGSPFTIVVNHDVTSSKHCKESFMPRNIIAGSPFYAEFATYDRFSNPTFFASDDLAGSFRASNTISSVSQSISFMDYNSGNNTFTIRDAFESTGEYELAVQHFDAQGIAAEIGGSPFRFSVIPAALDLTKTTDSLDKQSGTHDSSSNGPGDLVLSITPFDSYGNFIGNQLGFTAVVSFVAGGDSVVYDLVGPSYEARLSIPEDYEASVVVGFKHGEDWIQGSPKKIDFEPVLGVNVGGTAAGVGVSVVVLFLLIRHLTRRAMRQRMINMKVAFERNESKMKIEMANLHESLRKKKHSDKEIEVMMKAMSEMEAEQKDELRSVLIPSSEVKIVSLLGQGAFGTVSLATYKDQDVAVKQLMSIDDESVLRFRFECFLTKELRHPNVVRLVGVCWDDMMLGCCLEYIDGGSLEDRLNKDWTLPQEEKITWKGVMLKLATEAALGVQYLHNSRYYDENDGVWKDCIIHRDLKPDNMLVTKAPENILKLTDFGEARAAELNMTMTAVGTPIYISPEVLRNDRYDSKADTYSFGVVLVAMIRVDKTVIEFYFNSLMRRMKRKSRQGIGIGSLNRYLENGWRPPIPDEIYPKLANLISRCWKDEPTERPNFDEIVKELTVDINLEVQVLPEPVLGSNIIMEDDIVGKISRALQSTGTGDTLHNFATGTSFDSGVSDGFDLGEKTADELVIELTAKNEVLETENKLLKSKIEALKRGGVQAGVQAVVWDREPDPTVVNLSTPTIRKDDGGGEVRKAEPTIVDFGSECEKEPLKGGISDASATDVLDRSATFGAREEKKEQPPVVVLPVESSNSGGAAAAAPATNTSTSFASRAPVKQFNPYTGTYE